MSRGDAMAISPSHWRGGRKWSTSTMLQRDGRYRHAGSTGETSWHMAVLSADMWEKVCMKDTWEKKKTCENDM